MAAAPRHLLLKVPQVVGVCTKRNIGLSYVALQKVSDPIQKLFLDKVKEYAKKSSGGSMVDPTPEIQREHQQELTKLAKIYGGDKGVDMSKFPDFKFPEPKLDPIDLQQQ